MSETPVCGWCDSPAVTEVITRPGRKRRKTVPCCEKHARNFERREIPTLRSEFDRKQEAERKRKTWKVRQKWR